MEIVIIALRYITAAAMIFGIGSIGYLVVLSLKFARLRDRDPKAAEDLRQEFKKRNEQMNGWRGWLAYVLFSLFGSI